MYDFKGKVALVTGASRGIGRAIAVELARGGASVALNYAGNEAAAAEALALVQAAGAPKAKLYRFDVADSAACTAAVEAVVADLGGLHVLVNNAGSNWAPPYPEFPESAWERARAVHLLVWGYSRPRLPARLSLLFADGTSQACEVPLREWTDGTAGFAFDFRNTLEWFRHAAIYREAIAVARPERKLSGIRSESGRYGVVA